MKTALNQWLALAIFIAMSFAAAFIGGLFTSSSVGTWYTTLNKPSWTPPSWLFGPVWTALYFSMAVAAWLVWRTHEVKAAKVALALFLIQLVLNAAWSGFFFGMRNPGLAFAEIILLWGAILATMLAFWRMKPLAGWLFAPYLLWVTFAAALNFAIWRLNFSA
jgi:tryptophan-rich sensory protein